MSQTDLQNIDSDIDPSEGDKFHTTVEASHAGERLDHYLSEQIANQSRSAVQKWINDGLVLVNGSQCKSSLKLKAGDEVSATIPEPEPVDIKPENIPLDILYEDQDLLIVNKPKGMVVHPAPGHYTGTLVNAIMYHCGSDLSGINGEIRPGIVHRIDMNTTGSLIVCKNDFAHRNIAEQIKVHSIRRVYRGIAIGHMREPEGTIRTTIGRDPKNRLKMAVNVPHGKDAITHYKELKQLKNNYSYMEFALETGRTHQIRVHMASIGHPLLGDDVYGPRKCPYHLQGQTLHAMTIGFVHPRTGEYMEFNAPLPKYFTHLLQVLDPDGTFSDL